MIATIGYIEEVVAPWGTLGYVVAALTVALVLALVLLALAVVFAACARGLYWLRMSHADAATAPPGQASAVPDSPPPKGRGTPVPAGVETMGRFRTVDLSAYKLSVGAVKFLRAEVPSEPSPFALIRYSVEGEEQPLGLRLDMDKRVFLDHPGIPGINGKLEEAAPVVADALLA